MSGVPKQTVILLSGIPAVLISTGASGLRPVGHLDMKEPHLVIVARDGAARLWGRCSSCPEVSFPSMKAPKDRIKQEVRLQALFQQHFVKVHMRQNATEDHPSFPQDLCSDDN